MHTQTRVTHVREHIYDDQRTKFEI